MDRHVISGEGFPGTKEWIEFLEQSYVYPLKALAKMIGDLALIPAGQVHFADANPYAYYLTYDGEILPFVGAAPALSTATVVIREVVTEAGYDSEGTGEFNNQLPVWKKRYAEIGNPADANVVESFTWSALKQFKTLKEINEFKNVVGSIIIANNEINGFTSITTGEITSVELVPTGQFIRPRIKVYFDSISTTHYVPLVAYSGGTVISDAHSRNTAIVEKAVNYFVFEIQNATYVEGNSIYSQYFNNLAFQISIIKL